MKKALYLIGALLVTAFVACGPSAEERKQDSLQQESVKMETEQTADMLIEQMERENDSIAKADSIAAAQKAADSAAMKK